MTYNNDDTIVALSTPEGVGAIAVVRLSGKEAIEIVNNIFRGKDLSQQPSHTVHFGSLRDGDTVLDEALVSLFVAPNSFTKENVVEISCHGSPFIVQQVIQLLIRKGARPATAGEFTKRAFMNGQFDLAQAEAVADLIASDSEASHRAAMNQMRGGFSEEIKALRQSLVNFASMVELELDFSEEDVEFADRDELRKLVTELLKVITALVQSFNLGNVIKNGVPTVIIGKPNAGKSTLLNALLNEEKAIVSDVPGTTRDFIEDEITINGVTFRFIDTAGIRETTDKVESIGVARTHAKTLEASLIIYLIDLSDDSITHIRQEINRLENTGIPFIKVGNKVDVAQPELKALLEKQDDVVFLSAQRKENLEGLRDRIAGLIDLEKIRSGGSLVTNARHYQSLLRTQEALELVIKGLDSGITGDFLAQDIRLALHHLGEITGEITTDDLLGNIFSKFCIGK
jgi:tRNA modification GTPase